MQFPNRVRRNLTSEPSAKPSTKGPDVATGGAEPPASFDDWLDGRLKNLYEAVLNEPLPPEIMTLLGGQKSPDGSKGGTK
jgi:hypothetical protein